MSKFRQILLICSRYIDKDIIILKLMLKKDIIKEVKKLKQFTDFIVTKRNWILGLFIIFSVLSFMVSNNVNINYDITKYLPTSSETRIGMDIMEKEFEENQSSFNLMFKGLTEDKKNEIYNDLKNTDGVSHVDYEKNKDYNKDDYTLYIIHVSDVEDSKIASKVYEEIIKKYNSYEIYTSGMIAQKNNPVLPTWIIIIAVTSALIILIIMSESYIEPFLFLITILMAVVLNNGTNIFFHSVSNITSSISAILQMALSMDYSIMLINRYRQETEVEQDKIKAMKKALYNAFKSISSSSVTTIVGLIALVFMSFTIGKDLGFVLAKGVLFSLICIFFVLPSLILMFDKLIKKTKKKSINIKLNKLGKVSYKFRNIAIPIFLLILVVSYFQKGNLGILYTESQEDRISKIFNQNNQMAVIYKKENEKNISESIKEIEAIEKVKEVLGYSNTINQELKYDELNNKLKELGINETVEEYLLQILYYNYYNPNEDNTMTFDEFISFINQEVYKNISKEIDDETRKNINKLLNFTNETLFNKNRNIIEIANILEVDKTKVDDILVYYNSKNNDLKITLNEFINFMNEDVFTNKTYNKNISNKEKENINKLLNFTKTTIIQKKMTSEENAKLFGMDKNKIDMLYNYYISTNKIDTKLSINEFSKFILNNVLKNNQYSHLFNEETINNIKILNTFSNKEIINKNMNSKELAEILKIDEDIVKKLLFLNYSNIDSGKKLSITEFINQTIYIKNNTNYLNSIDISNIEKLSVFSINKNNINTTKMDKKMLSSIFDNVSKELVNKVYILMKLPDNHLMTPQEFINLVINKLSSNNETPIFNLDKNELNSIKILKLVIDDSVSNNKIRYTATELSNILNINKKQMYNIYAVINLIQNDINTWKLTPQKFIKLILDNSNNENIKNSISDITKKQLELLSNIINSTINKQTYLYNEITEVIGIDIQMSKNIYILYTTSNTNIKLTPMEFIEFIQKHKNDNSISNKLSQNTIKDLNIIQSVMNGTLSNKKYTSSELSNLLGINKKDLELLYGLYTSKYINTNQTISLKKLVTFIQNDVMKNNEYSSNFDEQSKIKISTINEIMNATVNKTKYSKEEIFTILTKLTDNLDKDMVDLAYIYHGSNKDYNFKWAITVEKFINYLNEKILNDSRFEDFIKDDMRKDIIDAKEKLTAAKRMLIGDNYSRIIINTTLKPETKETFEFIQKVKNIIGDNAYIIGNSPMACEMSKDFNNELNFITILTMALIFVVVAFTFKSIVIPIILVLTIQCAVYITMGILSLSGEGVYFIALLIVQSILMGATIDYAILYASYYIEHRNTMNIKDSIIHSYNKSIHTILTSASILIIVTLIVGHFSSAVAAKICKTISQGTLCSSILILVLLPAIIAVCDKLIIKNNN